MTTWAFLHAHPDDESTQTAGTMMLAKARGDRVIEILATDGAFGVAALDLRDGETVAQRRARELDEAAKVIGLDAVYRLGYHDSGMTGWESNMASGAFCNADLDEAGSRVAQIMRDEQVDILVHYDPHGGYGHPDHIMVHRVGEKAASLFDDSLRVLEGSMNQSSRDEVLERLTKAGVDVPGFWDADAVGDDGLPMGSTADQLRWQVDLPPEIIERKHQALACHASQTDDAGYFLALPAVAFSIIFGTEFYREPANPGPLSDGLF